MTWLGGVPAHCFTGPLSFQTSNPPPRVCCGWHHWFRKHTPGISCFPETGQPRPTEGHLGRDEAGSGPRADTKATPGPFTRSIIRCGFYCWVFSPLSLDRCPLSTLSGLRSGLLMAWTHMPCPGSHPLLQREHRDQSEGWRKGEGSCPEQALEPWPIASYSPPQPSSQGALLPSSACETKALAASLQFQVATLCSRNALTQGSPDLRPWTGTGPWPVRNQVATQEVRGGLHLDLQPLRLPHDCLSSALFLVSSSLRF